MRSTSVSLRENFGSMGQPLIDIPTVINLIGSTTTNNGLTVKCILDENEYQTGIKVSEEYFNNVDIEAIEPMSTWNYIIRGEEVMKGIIGRVFLFTYFFGCFFTVFTLHAQAYIDPSALTYVIQAVAGVLIALGAAFTIFRHKIFSFFKRKKKTEEPEDVIEFKNVGEKDAGENE